MDARSLLLKVTHAALALLLVLGAGLTLFTAPAYALNPPPLQTFYLTLPEDTMMQVFWDNFSGGTPTSPMRAITSITIGTYGTLVYYDQWEDGGYEVDIANPGSGLYDAATNPAGTQIWGDGSIANGCPPSINNVSNPCTAPEHDLLSRGDVITLDYEVVVQGSSGSFARNPAQVFYDGRDKVGATLPVAVTRAMWPVGAGSPGSLVADAQGVLPTDRWNTAYVSPVGENLASTGQSYEDVRWLIMAGTDGTAVSVDANGDGDYADANDLAAAAMAQGEVRVVDGIRTGATLTSNNPVQVTLLTADVNSTYENRFFNLIPRADWTHEYLTPVGTGGGTQCSNVWVYNPNAAPITVNYQIGGGAPATFTVGARAAAGSPNITTGNGARFWTTGSPAPDFLPISMTDCTNSTSGDIYDWGNELYPLDQLSPEITVGWAPGCSNEHPLGDYGVCLSTTGLANTTNTKSRSVVWVTPLAATTLYVDLDGSGISCTSDPTGAGAEQVIPANALQSVRIRNDPHNVRDMFSSTSYSANGPGNFDATWASAWIEVGETTSPTGGKIRIVDGALQFQNGSGGETNRAIHRAVNLAGMGYARLSFHSTLSGLGTNDRVAVEVSSTGAAGPYTLLQTYLANAATDVQIFDISAHATADTVIRFRPLDDWEGNELWRIDNVNIDFAAGDGVNGTYDMTGAYIRTCDEALLAAAVGQAPDLSFSSDNEGMDLGMGVPPYGSQMMLEKAAGVTFAAPGDAVPYTYTVRLIQTFSTSVNDVSVVDDLCAPAAPVLSGGYNIGDTNNDSALDAGETWIFTCTTHLFAETTNTAVAYAIYDGEPIRSAPDQATVLLTGLVGDYVWLDENADGVQDAGEPGIPNARVTLTGTDMDGDPVSLQTTTDLHGRYLFTDVPPGDAGGYAVSVDPGTLPTGLAANPTYDEDGVGTPHTTVVVLGSGEANRTADFGYNGASTADVTNPGVGAVGAIGDRVWVDADGDGVQDPGEPGLPGAAVTLYHDPDGDGVFDTPYDIGAYNPVRTTDAAGTYAFDDLPAGAYVVAVSPTAGYAQTGDPDYPGLPCGSNGDSRTTTPILLAPGDVAINADFGYQPGTASGNTVGDLIFLDVNGDGTWDAGEPGIPGVSVALLDAGGAIIATTTTDVSGAYAFAGLPDGEVTVWVNDVDSILGNLRQSSEPDNSVDGGQACATCNNRNTLTLSGGAGNAFQDFGYAPPGHSSGEGLIGDTVWLDRDGDGSYAPGEGLQGAMVSLLDGSGQVIARTVTNRNGQYFFGGLPAGSYTVDINTRSLPNAGSGLENHVDPDGGTPHRAGVTLGGSEPLTNLAQDFGYRYPTGANTIGGTLWDDANADGALDGGEAGRFAGVTVVLRDGAGAVVAVATTDALGDFSLTGLPDGTYAVDITDATDILNGIWHSAGPNPGADNNSQPDPYTVTVSGGQTDTTADFGYYRQPAALGDRVWLDVNGDGFQDPYDPGLPGVQVTLVVDYPNGESSTLTSVTDTNGFYSFGNLLLDEDFNGSGAGQPVYTLSVDTTQPALAGLVASPIDVVDDAADSDDPGGVVAAVVQGRSNLTFDFGLTGPVDTGNLLDSYSTLFASSGPGHVRGSLTLGTRWDADADGQPGATPADNDGVVPDPNNAWRPGIPVTFTVTLAGPAEATGYLVAWIDWENDGSFSETVVYDPLPMGSQALTVTVPGDYVLDTPVNVRFRLYETPPSSPRAPSSPAPTGVVIGGEVEDYQWEAKSTAVTFRAISATSLSAAIPPVLAIVMLLGGSTQVLRRRR